MKVTINKEKITLKSPCRIVELFDNSDYKYMAARVNNRLRELDFIITSDCDIELLDLNSSDVARIYQSTLRYVIVMAVLN